MEINFKCLNCANMINIQLGETGSGASVSCNYRGCGMVMRIDAKLTTNDKDERYRGIDWLDHNYTELGRSMSSIAKECRVSPMTIFHWLQTHSIDTRSRGRRKKVV